MGGEEGRKNRGEERQREERLGKERWGRQGSREEGSYTAWLVILWSNGGTIAIRG